MKKSEKIEYVVKGFANRHRVDLLRAISNNPGIDVGSLAEVLGLNYQTMSVHLRQLSQTGLVHKKYKGRFVIHQLTARGEQVITFLKVL